MSRSAQSAAVPSTDEGETMGAQNDKAGGSMRTAWEYVLVGTFVGDLPAAAKRLNELGAEGWEVVGSVPGDSNSIVHTLKRAKNA
ncbi:MAG: hypothetical protein U0169_17990 [Polyangiaceae bacterium]